MEKKTQKNKKKLLEIYKDGNFIYAKSCKNITPREYMAVIGLCQTLIETTKQGKRKCLH